ncbi:MAG: hypothetical protein QM697_03095 [Lachnospiraceae bacterium]
MSYDVNKEIREAISAGERALNSLREAQDYLKSAGNWGIVDILGGGLITDLIKHSKLNNASECMEAARQDLRSFQRELDDVNEYLPNIQIGDFLTFADFFFDGFIADMFVQSKIGDAKEQVAEAIDQVERIVSRLRKELR